MRLFSPILILSHLQSIQKQKIKFLLYWFYGSMNDLRATVYVSGARMLLGLSKPQCRSFLSQQ